MIWRGPLLILGLAAVIGCELRVGDEAAEPLIHPQVVPDLDAARPGQTEAALDTSAPANASTAFARPLFRPDRRPPSAAVTASPAPPGETLPRLAGIVVTASARQAIFDGGDGKPATATESGRLGSFRVVRIAADRVTVTGPGGTFTLRPTWQAGSSSPAPVTAPRLANTINAGGATFGAVPADRLARLRDQVTASIQTLRASP